MTRKSIERLAHFCDIIPALLRSISEREMCSRHFPDKWSKKEILGHLIDSAANNHQRFVRGQFENEPAITYDQVQWNKHGYYNSIDTGQLILMWEIYNRQLGALISFIPEEKLQNKVRTGDKSHTLAYLAEDYVIHMEHHLRQLVDLH